MASVSTRSSSGETSNGCAPPLGFLSHDSSTGVMTQALTAMVSTQMVPMTATFCMSGIGVSTTTIMQPASAITPSMPGLKSWSIAELAAARVVSAPAACPREVSKLTLALGRALSRLAPNTGVLRLPLNRISRDPAVVDAYNHDPLVFRTPIRARLGAEMLAAMDRVDAGLPGLRIPLLVMQGTADGLVDPGCGPHVYERAGSADKTLKMYDGLWHEIFNEPERDHVLDDLAAWVRVHLA